MGHIGELVSSGPLIGAAPRGPVRGALMKAAGRRTRPCSRVLCTTCLVDGQRRSKPRQRFPPDLTLGKTCINIIKRYICCCRVLYFYVFVCITPYFPKTENYICQIAFHFVDAKVLHKTCNSDANIIQQIRQHDATIMYKLYKLTIN